MNHLGGPTEVVCNTCGHQWTEPHEYDLPATCENCGRMTLQFFPLRIIGNDEAAEEHAALVFDNLT